MLHDICSIVLLVGVAYECFDNNHRLISYDPEILHVIPDTEMIPFCLTHKSGFTKQFMKYFVAQLDQVHDFSKVVNTIKACRDNLKHSNPFNYPAWSASDSENSERSNSLFNLPLPSRFTLTSLYLQQFFHEKEDNFNNYMKAMTCDRVISIEKFLPTLVISEATTDG